MYTRTERMKSLRLREVNKWNASSTLTNVEGDIEWSYHASGSLVLGSRMLTDWKGRLIAVRIDASHPERVFAERPTGYLSYLFLALSLLGWLRYGRGEKSYV